MTHSLQLEIKNTAPLVLTDLTISLLAFSHQYSKYIERTTKEAAPAAKQLVIKEVRSGSVIIDLLSYAGTTLPLIWSSGCSIIEWYNQAKAVLEWLLDKKEKPPMTLNKTDLSQWGNFLNPVAQDHGSQINLSVRDKSQVTINQYVINSSEAAQAIKKIQKEAAALDDEAENIHRRKLMYWFQTKFVDHAETGDKAIIDDISKKPVKVIFENDEVKRHMLAGDRRFSRSWHELAYVVDVEVMTVRDQPRMYKIIRYHPDDTIDPAA